MATLRTRLPAPAVGALLGAVALAAAASTVLIAHGDNTRPNAAHQSTTMAHRTSRDAQATPTPASAHGNAPAGGNPQSAHAVIGVSIHDTNGHIEVASVVSGGPADKAGIKQGDVITAIDGTNLAAFAGLHKALEAKKPGDTVTLTVSRNGSNQDIKVTLGDISTSRGAGGNQSGPAAPRLGPIGGGNFDHFISTETKTKDDSGTVHTDTTIAGVVKSATGGQVVVTPNGGGGDQTLSIDGNTRVLKGLHGNQGNNGGSALAANDKVFVTTRDGSSTATLIVVANAFPQIGGPGSGNRPGANIGPGGGGIHITLPNGQSIDFPPSDNGAGPRSIRGGGPTY